MGVHVTGKTGRPQPGFLGVGAPRAGTSWLHRNLRRHPELWLPPVKELHYFDAQRPGAGAYFKEPHKSFRRVSWGWYLHTSRGLMRRALRLRAPLGWTCRYILGRRNDAWYARLFRNDLLSGEITPAYMFLPRPVIEEIRALNPEMKILLLLRNPIDRTWSSTRKKLARRSEEASVEELLALTEKPGVVLRNDYVSAISNWRGVFGDQVFIGFFDDLVVAPRDLFRSVLQFLCVDSCDKFIPDDIDKTVGASPAREMPGEIALRMAATYLDQLRELEKLVGGHASAWRTAAEATLAPPQT
jgi:hypothetical protein